MDIIIAGQYDLIPERKKYDVLGWFPARFWDIYHDVTPEEAARIIPTAQHCCKRCKRAIKPEYEYCYHCRQRLEEAKRTSRTRAGRS